MSRFRNVFTTTAILVGSSAALLTGGIAKADPAPVPLPPVPGLSMIQGLLDPANAPQLLQAASSVLSGASAVAPAPVATPPIASASVNLPQQPAALPGTAALPGVATLPGTAPAAVPAASPGTATLPGTVPAAVPAALPGTATLPGIAPAAVPAATAPAVATPELIPTGQLNLPSLPGLPVPLPQHLSFPGDLDLASLIPGTPGAAIAQPGVAPAASATSPMPAVGALFPTSALP
jgi:hypothetical protein